MNTKIYKKDFDGWNEQKKITHNKENKKTFHEQEIWFIKIGKMSVGDYSKVKEKLTELIR